MVAPCPVCLTHQQILESHHIFPIALGGPKDGPQMILCAICHRSIHFAADALFSKNKKTRRKASDHFSTPDAFDKAKGLIRAILEAKEHHRSGNANHDNKRRKMVTISVTDNEWIRFRKAARDKNMTAERLIENIVRRISNDPTL